MLNRALLTSATPEWYTPPDILAAVHTFYGGDFYDPCPAQKDHMPRPDGLAEDWAAHGNKTFVNPPYGRTIGQWTRKALAYAESSPMYQVILLVPARTDTKWFQPLIQHPICFVAGRLHFSGATAGAPFPSALVYLGWGSAIFARQFAHWGRVVVPYSALEVA